MLILHQLVNVILYFSLAMDLSKKNFKVLKDLWRNLILELNCQSSYKIGCNWNIYEHQHITYNNKCLCTSMPSTEKTQ